jgi:endonuclease/exonuclease/phosphatase family metal-dependent hydrolase
MKRHVAAAAAAGLAALGLAALGLLAGLAGVRAGEAAADVRVMSYNVRYGTAPDGENHWDKRKALLAETVKAFDPDLLGTQETLAAQRDYLAGQLPKHAAFGVGREDGKEAGEMMAVFWRADRFEKLAGGHFWLSASPDAPGVKGWDAAHPRMVTWVKLRDRTAPGAKPVLWLNTHLDNRGRQARVEGAKALRDRMGALGDGCSLVVTGDFNAAEGSEPYQAVFGPRGGRESPVVDTFRVAHPARGADEGTASGFKADATRGNRIDWIGPVGTAAPRPTILPSPPCSGGEAAPAGRHAGGELRA